MRLPLTDVRAGRADQPIGAAVAPGTAPLATASSLRRALRRARDGVTLDPTEAAILLQAKGSELTDLCSSAARVRDAGLVAAGRPGVITFSKKVFIPLTRLCRDRCHYCTFASTPGRLPAPFLSADEVVQIADAGREMGCKEALFTLGDRPEERWPAARRWLDEAGYSSTLDYVRAMSGCSRRPGCFRTSIQECSVGRTWRA